MKEEQTPNDNKHSRALRASKKHQAKMPGKDKQKQGAKSTQNAAAAKAAAKPSKSAPASAPAAGAQKGKKP